MRKREDPSVSETRKNPAHAASSAGRGIIRAVSRRSDPASWRRAREIFDAVVSLAPAKRDLRLANLAPTTLTCGTKSNHCSLTTARPRTRSPRLSPAPRDATAPEAVLHPGQSLLHYTLTARIGEGGMGVVWRAADRSLGREVAIKTLPASIAGDRLRLARFEREAKLLAALDHSNVAAIYSVHEFEGVRFLAMG